MAAPAPAEPFPAAVARIAAFMRGFSIEATRPTGSDLAALAVLAPSTRIYLSAVPGRPAEEAVAAAIHLRAAGFEPVPHVAVRNFASVSALGDFLARLNGEADVQRVLIIAGDRAQSGPFRHARDALGGGLLPRRGIRAIGIAGYPEGHPRIGAEELDRAIAGKIAAAEANGLAVEIVTQFCFDSRAILDYVARLRAAGLHHRVRVGLAGPTGPASLLRYAARCGVRASARAIGRRTGLRRELFAVAVPDDLVRGLADASLNNVSAHFFSFGGLPATARWASAVADGRIQIEGETGFRIAGPT